MNKMSDSEHDTIDVHDIIEDFDDSEDEEPINYQTVLFIDESGHELHRYFYVHST